MPIKPTQPEDTFFAHQELKLKRSLAQAREEKFRLEERQTLRDLHWMRCPKCGMELLEIEYQGHKVDRCSSCRGLWLDPGELESLARPEASGFLGNLKKVFEG